MTSFAPLALEQLTNWIQQDRKIALRILRMIAELEKKPFTGIGKPEPLKGDFKGYWSRRIDNEHRLIYKITHEGIQIHSCYSHYEK
jgi:toxin YoeB